MVPVARFFGEQKLLLWFPLMQPFHILYTIIAGWLGKFGKYTWKGRVVNKCFVSEVKCKDTPGVISMVVKTFINKHESSSPMASSLPQNL